jgi:ABC-type glycerol-3-phosphate transport system permease component
MENKLSLHLKKARIFTHDLLRSWLSYIILVPWCAFTVFIFLWLISTSFKTNRELYANLWGIPSAPTWANFTNAWGIAHIGNYFTNSLLIVSISMAFTILLGAMGAYALARIPFKGSIVILYSLIGGMGIPIQLLLVPLFMLLSKIHLVNHPSGLIVSYIAYLLPFTMFLLVGFFRTIPTEIAESAAMDGASDLTIFWRIMLPLSSPGLITAAIFNFITLWNEYLLALVILGKPETWTVSLGLYNLNVAMGSTADWVSLFAGVVIIMLPAMLLYIFLSEHIISGLTLGATKG